MRKEKCARVREVGRGRTLEKLIGWGQAFWFYFVYSRKPLKGSKWKITDSV